MIYTGRVESVQMLDICDKETKWSQQENYEKTSNTT